MIDHLGIAVSDLDRSRAFYLAALAPLGFAIALEVSAEQTGSKAFCGFGIAGKPELWISKGEPQRMHIALAANDRSMVDAFYQAALDAGGRDHGVPGLRPHYHEHYYAAFVLDPDGHNVEAVCHAPVNGSSTSK